MDDSREGGLLAWQWADYARVHLNRRNLVLHLAGAPLFLAGCIGLVAGIGRMQLPIAGLGLLGLAAGFLLQGAGHRLETERPLPFRGPGDLLVRFFVEQWVTFPRFVLSGGLTRAWRGS